MPLELTDFDQAGLEVDALALIVAAAPPNVYADADRGGAQTPEGGELGIGAGGDAHQPHPHPGRRAESNAER